MALPQEGLLTLQQVNIELSKEPEAHITMNDSDVRALAKRPANESSISFDDLKGRTTGIAEYIIRYGHSTEDLVRMVNRELGDLSKVHIIFEDGLTAIQQVFFDEGIANDITKGPYKMSGNTITDLNRFFRGCENMTEIGPELFYGLPKLKSINSIFQNCPIKQYHSAMFKFNPELKELPDGVFDDSVKVPVDVFEGSAIEVISGPIRNESLDILNPIKNTIREINASIFQGRYIEPKMFADCVNLSSVKVLCGNFRDRKGALTTGENSSLSTGAFTDLPKLDTVSNISVSGISEGAFKNLPALIKVSNFDIKTQTTIFKIFDNCPNINDISNLFGNSNIELANTNLQYVDPTIFDECPNIMNCSGTFANCLAYVRDIPELWKRANASSIIHDNYASGTTKASNYQQVPVDWGGPSISMEQRFTSKEDFDSRIQGLIASGKIKDMTFILDGDFTQAPNLIRFPVETTETPKYITTTNVVGGATKFNIDSMFEDCVNLRFISPVLFDKVKFIESASKAFKNSCVEGTVFPPIFKELMLGLWDVSECFMNSKCVFEEAPFNERHQIMNARSCFENSKVDNNFMMFWGSMALQSEFTNRDLTRMFANTRLSNPMMLWNGWVDGSRTNNITYYIILDEMFAETDLTKPITPNYQKMQYLRSCKGMFRGTKITDDTTDFNGLPCLIDASYLYADTGITRFRGLTKKDYMSNIPETKAISLEGICQNCVKLTEIPYIDKTMYDDLTALGDYTRYYPSKSMNPVFTNAFKGCNAITRALPKLWEIYESPVNKSNDCFKDCISASNYTEVPPEWGGPSKIEKVFTFNSKEEFDSNIQSIYTSNKIDECGLRFTYSPVQIQFPSYFTLCPKYIECDHLDATELFSYTNIEVIPATIFDRVDRITSCKEMCKGMNKLKDVQFTLKQYTPKLERDINISGMFYTGYTTNKFNIPTNFFVNVHCSLEDNYYNPVFEYINFGDNELDLSQTTITNNNSGGFYFYGTNVSINTITSKSIPICNSLKYFVREIKTNRIAANVLENIDDLNKLSELFYYMHYSENIIIEDIFSTLKPTIKSLINMGVYPEINLSFMFGENSELKSIDMTSLIEIFELYNSSEQGKNKIDISGMFNNTIKFINTSDFEIPILTKYDNIFSSKYDYCKGRIICRNYNEIPYAYGGPKEIHRFANKAVFEEYRNANTGKNWNDTVVIFENGLENETLEYFGNTTPDIIYADKCTALNYVFVFTAENAKVSSYLFWGMPNIESLRLVFLDYINITFTYDYNLFENNKKINNIEELFNARDKRANSEINYLNIKLDNPDLVINKILTRNMTIYKHILSQNTFDINCKSLRLCSATKLYDYGNINLGKDIENLDYCFDYVELPNSYYINGTFNNLKSCRSAFNTYPSNINKLNATVVNSMLSSPVLENCKGAFKNENVQIEGNLNIPYNVMFSTLTDCSELFNGQSNLTGKAPRLWELAPNAVHTNCFKGCTSLSNYDEIPDDWK